MGDLLKRVGIVAERRGRVLRTEHSGLSLMRLGLIAVVVSSWLVYMSFSRTLPWQTGFEIKAVFQQALNIRVGAPVRIAGVDVGKVTGSGHADGSPLTTVTMAIEDNGLPIHRDASLKIQSRTFLEGNYFVALRPGTPSMPDLDSGDTVPVGQTAATVQIDQVLSSLQGDTRKDLQRLLQNLGAGLDKGKQQSEGVATPIDSGRSETAGEALNKAFKSGATGLKATAQSNRALLGSGPNDLTKLVKGLNGTVRGLDQNAVQLQDLVTNLNITTGALAAVNGDLSASVRELPRTLAEAKPMLVSLNEALPPLREFSDDVRPGIRDIPITVDSTLPWIDQVTRLVDSDELGAVTKTLHTTTPDLASVAGEATSLLPQINATSRCFVEVFIPVANQKIKDSPFTDTFPATENYKMFAYDITGLAGLAQSFDGNGPYLRGGLSGGPTTITSGPINGVGQSLVGKAIEPFQGFRPKYPGKEPPKKTDVACYKNRVPDLNSAETAVP